MLAIAEVVGVLRGSAVFKVGKRAGAQCGLSCSMETNCAVKMKDLHVDRKVKWPLKECRNNRLRGKENYK